MEALMVHHDILIEAAPEKVWAVITSAEGMKKWLNPKTFEPNLGGKVDFLTTHEGVQYYMFGEVVTFDPPSTLAFTWTEQPVGKEAWPTPTLVTIRLVPEAGGTRINLEHSGFENLPSDIAQSQFEDYTRGWAYLHDLDNLKAMVEQG